MEIKEIKNKEAWENFFLECPGRTFLQSWNWGVFNEMTGNKIWRIGLYDKASLILLALVIKIKAKRGTFLFCPHGPYIRSQYLNFKSEILREFLEALKKIAQQEEASFIKIAPNWERNKENNQLFKKIGFREAPIHIHPELTWELDIRPEEEQLLMNMRKTTRYLIRQAQKSEDIEINQATNAEDIEIFNKLYQDVASRHHFVPFSLNYLKKEFLAFQPDNQIALFLGKYRNEIVSGGIFVFWSNIAFYHHGASLSKYSKFPVSYLLQWQSIKEAKIRDCRAFNFWGIAPISPSSFRVSPFKPSSGIQNFALKLPFRIQSPAFKKHPWAGLTMFKVGFGGYKKEYVRTQDFSFSKKYWLTYIFEKLRKKKRGL